MKVWLAALWSVAPDIFSFAPVFIWVFAGVIFGGMSFSDLPGPDSVEPMARNSLAIFRFTDTLYNITHSLTIFLIAAGLVGFFGKRIPWEAGGWLFHILIDIPTHSYKFYPTPFLWPFSEWKFDGFAWGNWWFMIINYSLLILVFLALRSARKKG